MRVVLDTNVLISALLWKGKTHEILSLIEKGTITPCFSLETSEELYVVLIRNQFTDRIKKTNINLKVTIAKLLLKSEFFKLSKSKPVFIKEDPTDDMFLLLAQTSKSKYLVSGDKHLLNIKRFGTTKIISVSDFLKLFN